MPHFLKRLTYATLRGYAAVAPTGRGGFHLARSARRTISRSRWVDVFDTGHGVRLELDLATYPDFAMAAGLYELDTERLLRRLVRPGMTVVDGGANLGFFTCRMARRVGDGGHVHAFEPDPVNCRRLTDNLDRNGLTSRVTVHPLALSDAPAALTFHRPTEGSGRNHGESGRFPTGDVTTEAFDVQAARMDEVLRGPIDVVKLDVEGSETPAVRGMTGLLTGSRPPTILLEHNPPVIALAGGRGGDVLRAVSVPGLSYQCRVVDGRERVDSPQDLDRLEAVRNLILEPVK